MTNKYDPPQPTTSDAGTAIARALVQGIPLGGSALELLNLAIAPPLERRRDEWARLIAEGLAAIEVKLEDLGTHEDLLDMFLKASAAAMRTSSNEKLKALRNGVLNVALAQSVDESLTHIFLDWIDRFTVRHLRLLRAVDDPPSWSKEHNILYAPATSGPLADFLVAAFPDLADRRDFLDLMWAELFQAALVTIPVADMHWASSDHGSWPSRTSEIGKAFLRFIQNP